MRYFAHLFAIFSLISLQLIASVPTGYVHKPIAEQLKAYRMIYDHALEKTYHGNVEDIKTKPIDGLFLILKNAFALVHDGILAKYPVFPAGATKDERLTQMQSLWEQARKRGDQQKYLQALEELWKQAESQKDVINSALFQNFNLRLAYILESYKNGTAMDFEKWLAAYWKEAIGTDKYNDLNDVVFIAYLNPNPIKGRGLAADNFIEQVCGDTYSSYLAVFDVLETKKTGQSRTKKDPHWSTASGTPEMLAHDFVHCQQQANKDWQGPASLHYVKRLCEFRSLYPKDPNKLKVIRNGLFMLTHEFPRVLRGSSMSFIDHFSSHLSELKDTLISTLYAYGTEGYKIAGRDEEFILKDTYKDPRSDAMFLVHDDQGRTFFPTTLSFDPLKKAYTKSRPFADTNDKQKRNELMKKALKEGYTRYWDYFFGLIKDKLNLAPSDELLLNIKIASDDEFLDALKKITPRELAPDLQELLAERMLKWIQNMSDKYGDKKDPIPEAVQVQMARSLDDTNGKVRLAAFDFIGRNHENLEFAYIKDRMIEATLDPDPKNRYWAIRTLWGTKDFPSRTRLLKTLASPLLDKENKINLINGAFTGWKSGEDEIALAITRIALANPDRELRKAAQGSFGRVDADFMAPHRQLIAEAILNPKVDFDEQERRNLIDGLRGRLYPGEETVAHALFKVLNDENSTARLREYAKAAIYNYLSWTNKRSNVEFEALERYLDDPATDDKALSNFFSQAEQDDLIKLLNINQKPRIDAETLKIYRDGKWLDVDLDQAGIRNRSISFEHGPKIQFYNSDVAKILGHYKNGDKYSAEKACGFTCTTFVFANNDQIIVSTSQAPDFRAVFSGQPAPLH